MFAHYDGHCNHRVTDIAGSVGHLSTLKTKLSWCELTNLDNFQSKYCYLLKGLRLPGLRPSEYTSGTLLGIVSNSPYVRDLCVDLHKGLANALPDTCRLLAPPLKYWKVGMCTQCEPYDNGRYDEASIRAVRQTSHLEQLIIQKVR